MAKSTIGAAIALDGEKEFKKAVSSINSDLKVLTSEMGKVTSSFANNGNSMSALKAKSEQYSKQIEAQKNKIETLRAALENSQKNYNKAAENVNKWQQQLSEAKTELDRLKKSENATTEEIEEQEKAVADLSNKLKTAESNYEKAENKTKQWQISLNKAETELNKTQSELNDVNSKLKTIGTNAGYSAEELDEARNKLKSFGDSAKTAGDGAKKAFQAVAAAAATVGVAIGGITAKSISIGSEFETQMKKVQAISGASAEQLSQLTEKAKEMGSTTKFTATQSGEALEYMAMAGWNTGDMLAGLSGVMNLAAASGEDLGTTSDIVTDALTAFGIKAEESGHFADILAQASSKSNTNVGMMGETFKYVAPLCGTMGYSAEDTAVAIGLMANAGIKGSQAGTTLKNALANMAAPTDAMESAMKELGISITNNDGTMKSLDEVVGVLRKSFAGLTEDQQAAYAKTIFGKDAMSGMLAVINTSTQNYNALKSAIYGCDGAAQQMADTMNDNLNGQVTILQSGLEGLAIDFYEGLQKPLTNGIKSITTAVNSPAVKSGVQQISKSFGELAADLSAFTARNLPKVISEFKQVAAYMSSSSFKSAVKSAGSLFASSGKVIATFGKITLPAAAKGFELLAKSGKVLIPVLASTYAGFKAFKAVTATTELVKKAKDAFAALNVVMAANPYAVAAAAIAAVGVALVGLSATCGETEDKYADLDAQLDETAQSMKDMAEARQESYKAAYAEIYEVERLKARLGELVDENGDLKGSKEELKGVIEKLNEYGFKVELSKTGDLIKNYDELSQSIDEYLQKKELQAKLDSLDTEYKDYKANYDKIHAEVVEAQKAYEDEVAELNKRMEEEGRPIGFYEEELKSIEKRSLKIEEAAQREADALELISAVEDVWSLQEAGKLDEANKRLDSYFEKRNETFKHYADYEASQRKQAITELGEQLNGEISLYNVALDNGSQYLIDKQLENIQKAADELAEAGIEIPEGLVDGIKSGEISVEEAMQIISSLVENGAGIDLTSEGESATKSYADGVLVSKSDVEAAAKSVGNTAVKALNSKQLRITAASAGAVIGGAYAGGISGGILSKLPNVQAQARKVVAAAAAASKAQGKIHSPSRLTRDEIGKPLAEGIGVGIEIQSHSVAKKAAAATQRIMSSMWTETKNLESVQHGYDYAVNKLNKPNAISINSLPSDVINLLAGSGRQNITVTNNNTFNGASARDGSALIRQLNRALGANI